MMSLQSPNLDDVASRTQEIETPAPESKAAELTVPEPQVPEPTISLLATYKFLRRLR